MVFGFTFATISLHVPTGEPLYGQRVHDTGIWTPEEIFRL